MDEALSIDGIEDIERVWSLHSASTGSTRLLCSTAYNSFLLQIEPIVEVLPLAAEVTDLPLFAASADSAGIQFRRGRSGGCPDPRGPHCAGSARRVCPGASSPGRSAG